MHLCYRWSLEGWVRLWETPADIFWLKEDTVRGLFTPVQVYKDIAGACKRRRVLKLDQMWFHLPDPPGFVGGALPTAHQFFCNCVFVWCPVGSLEMFTEVSLWR